MLFVMLSTVDGGDPDPGWSQTACVRMSPPAPAAQPWAPCSACFFSDKVAGSENVTPWIAITLRWLCSVLNTVCGISEALKECHTSWWWRHGEGACNIDLVRLIQGWLPTWAVPGWCFGRCEGESLVIKVESVSQAELQRCENTRYALCARKGRLCLGPKVKKVGQIEVERKTVFGTWGTYMPSWGAKASFWRWVKSCSQTRNSLI